MNNNVLYIEFFILFFMITVSTLLVLFSIYYISPYNYTFYKLNDNYKMSSKKNYTIQSNDTKKIRNNKYLNKLFRIYSESDVNISTTLENKFKSENIYLTKNDLIKLNNSNLIIKNNNGYPLKVIVEIYTTK